jgi:hypothetical protein
MAEQKPLKLVVGSPNTIAEMNSASDTIQEALLPGTVAKLTATQTLVNKTISSPAISLIESKGAANATIVQFSSTLGSTVGSACDHVKIVNAASGTGGTLQAENSGASNVDLNLAGKGTGKVKVGGSEIVTATSTTIMTNKTLNSPTIVTPTISSSGFASANHGHIDTASGGRLSGAAISSSVRGVALHSSTPFALMPTASSYKTASAGGAVNNWTGAIPALSDFSDSETSGAFGGQPYMTTRSRLSYLNYINTNLNTGTTGYISFGPQWRISGPASGANAQEQAGHYTNWLGPAASATAGAGPYETQYYTCTTVGSSSVLNASGVGKCFEMRLSGRLVTTGTSTVWNIGVVPPTGTTTPATLLSTAALAAGTYSVFVSVVCTMVTSNTMYQAVASAQVVNSAGALQALIGSYSSLINPVSPDSTVRYLSIGIGNNTAMATGTPSFFGVLTGMELN